ncbi:Uncharacterised protein [Legionella busanensis]|uniref:SnoaL-like domain-containing protein n=1 Tax=Legionella busanensis TaxID=190655 RepID=A0A378K9V1_9GAMM|nr:hypothetical protein [Legionella busanensis]STX81487.1 Uncharacterised protein [Legionella busanensis]
MKLKYFPILLIILCTKSFALPWDTETRTNIPFRSEKPSKITQQQIERIFNLLEKTNANRKLLSKNVLSNFFTDDVVYIVNGVTVATDIEGLSKRLQRVSSFLKSYRIKTPLISLVIANNLANITYEFTEQRINGQKFHNIASVAITYKDNKISKWDAILEHTNNSRN